MNGFEEYSKFLSTLNESIVVYNKEKVVWANDKVTELMKYSSPDEIIGTSPFIHVHPDLLIDFQKNVETRTKTPQPTSGLWKLRCKDGSYRTIHSNGSVIVLDGKTYLISIFRDPVSHIEHRYSSSQLQHDLLTPLTIAKGYIEILQNRNDDPESQRCIEAIQESCKKMESTITKIVNSLHQTNLIDSVTETEVDE